MSPAAGVHRSKLATFYKITAYQIVIDISLQQLGFCVCVQSYTALTYHRRVGAMGHVLYVYMQKTRSSASTSLLLVRSQRFVHYARIMPIMPIRGNWRSKGHTADRTDLSQLSAAFSRRTSAAKDFWRHSTPSSQIWKRPCASLSIASCIELSDELCSMQQV